MQPKIYNAKDHKISPHQIDRDALFVINKLQQAGFIAYAVGGCVRDLLLGKKPKDFDIVTSAHPYQIKKLFNRCFLIGRRFRLAHVLFGKKVIEVATFRSGSTSSKLIVQDNTFGTPEQDALRRDFTINALFYDPIKNTILDFVGGYIDVKKHFIQTIGKPKQRFLQDPVRMLRMIKFQAKFGLKVDGDAKSALSSCRKEILKSSPARIFEEIFKILESGHAHSIFELMSESDMLKLIFPWLEKLIQSGRYDYSLIKNIDNKIKRGGNLRRPVLLAALIFPSLKEKIDLKQKTKIPSLHEIHEITYNLIQGIAQNSFASFPKKMQSAVIFILHAQYRLRPISNKHISKRGVAKHPDFKLALEFLNLR